MGVLDLERMTKEELIKLAEKCRIKVKASSLKKELLETIKHEMKKSQAEPGKKKHPVRAADSSSAPASNKGRGPSAAKTVSRRRPATGDRKAGPSRNGGGPKPSARTPASGEKEREIRRRPAQSRAAKTSQPRTAPSPRTQTVEGRIEEGESRRRVSAAQTPAASRPQKPKPRSSRASVNRQKIATGKPVVPQGKKVSPPRVSTRPWPVEVPQFRPVFEIEDMAQEAKFIVAPPEVRGEDVEPTAVLPENYEDNRLVMLIRDPYWVHLFWEIQPWKVEEGLRTLNRRQDEVSWILRVIDSGGARGGYPMDVGIDPSARSWYLQLSPPGASFHTQIGLIDREGRFTPLAVSNTVTLPVDGPSDIVDERWMTTGEEFRKIYLLSAGGRHHLQSGSEGLQGLQGREMPFGISSWGRGSVSSADWQTPPERERGFRFWLDAELIVYGGTEPDARVTLMGEPVTLRSDGTFSVRLALPDGTLNLPVTAESQDEIEQRTIEPVVARKTETQQPLLKEW